MRIPASPDTCLGLTSQKIHKPSFYTKRAYVKAIHGLYYKIQVHIISLCTNIAN